MKALGVAELSGGDWLLEVKYDGFRALAVLRDGEVELWSRNHKPLTPSYPEVAEALRRLKTQDAVLDGEIVALDEQGRPSFQLLQRRDTAHVRPPIYYYVFDLIHLDGRPLASEPIEARRAQLERVLKSAPKTLRLSPIFEEDPDVLLEEVRRQGLEGIVGKRRGSFYEPGQRSGAWVKRRVAFDQEFVIGGFTPPRGGRSYFGAVLVGYYEGGVLRYAGKVGTGFDAKKLKLLYTEFEQRRKTECPFTGMERSAMRGALWVEPELVCQVKFSEWTRDGLLRQPVILGLRDDKRAREVVREIAAP